MFCGKCGTNNDEGSVFCAGCGAPLQAENNNQFSSQETQTMNDYYQAPTQQAQPTGGYYQAPVQSQPAGGYYQAPAQSQPAGGYYQAPVQTQQAQYTGAYYPQPKKDNKKLLIFAGAGVALVAIVVCLVVFVFGGKGGNSSYEKVVDKYMEAQTNFDAKAVLELVPDAVVNEVIEDEGYDSYNEFISDKNEEAEEYRQYMEMLGGSISIKHTIVGAEDITGDDLLDTVADYAEYGVVVDAAKCVNVKITTSAMGMSDESEEEIYVIKVGNSWYLDAFNMYLF